jgi:hypothetical protein
MEELTFQGLLTDPEKVNQIMAKFTEYEEVRRGDVKLTQPGNNLYHRLSLLVGMKCSYTSVFLEAVRNVYTTSYQSL